MTNLPIAGCTQYALIVNITTWMGSQIARRHKIGSLDHDRISSPPEIMAVFLKPLRHHQIALADGGE